MSVAVDANTEMVLPFVTDEATSMVIQKKVVPFISWENAGNVCVPAAVGVKLVANNVAPANELVALLQILKFTISDAVYEPVVANVKLVKDEVVVLLVILKA